MVLQEYRYKLEQLKGKRTWLQDKKKKAQENLLFLNDRLNAIEKSQVFIQTVAKNTQEQLKFHIEDVVQLALDAVFPGAYEFCVQFDLKRGSTEARLVFLEHGQEISPLDSAGGGVADIVSFALRLSVWSLGSSSKIIILDEPFKYLSKDLQDRAGEILRCLSQKLKLQIIMVSHCSEMVSISDKVFSVQLEKKGKWKKSIVLIQ